jgi:Cu2+-exporting ATPase
VPAGARYGVTAEGRWRAVCCAGCEAVAATILGQGLGDYYRLRARADVKPASETPGDDLTVYDDPGVQRGFVGRDGNACDALLLLEGIRCSACAWLNERAVARLPGVLEADVNYATHRMSVRWDSSRVRLSEILAAVRRIGYRASPHDPARFDALQSGERRDALWRLFVAGFGMMQVMMYALPAYLAGDGEMSADIGQLMRWASLALTLPVVAYSAAPFFSGAWRDLLARRLGMDAPVALGIAVAFGASVATTVAGSGAVYFDSISMFVFLLLLGRYFELLARQRSIRSLQHLGRLVPEFAHRLGEFPRSLEADRVPAAALNPGDRVLVKPGEIFPADGLVEEGSSLVSEALLSGEAKPVGKSSGSAVIAGAANLTSPLIVRVERIGPATVLSSILRLVERAAAEKPRLIELADRAASWFILVVLILAATAGVFWAISDPGRALPVVVAVLVATCPCALSLATPIALTVTIAELAGRGVVIARSRAIEALARATDVVFDKTGTLTSGELSLARVTVCGGVAKDRCLALAAAIESASEHPVARAILDAAPAGATLRAAEIRNNPGAGIDARVEGRRYRIGTLAFTRELASQSRSLVEEPRGSPVWLADESGLLAALSFEDALRPEAKEAVRALQALGVTVHLLSGDGEDAVRDVAAGARIGIARAQATPELKREYVIGLQKQGRVVAMVGDGINDAPVLAQADVSVAMGGGARLAQMRADAVLVSQDLRELPRAIERTRRTLGIVRQNVAWAFAYNLLALPLALAGLLTPWLAALGMAGSSLVVTMNALRLQNPRRRAGEGQFVQTGKTSAA